MREGNTNLDNVMKLIEGPKEPVQSFRAASRKPLAYSGSNVEGPKDPSLQKLHINSFKVPFQ